MNDNKNISDDDLINQVEETARLYYKIQFKNTIRLAYLVIFINIALEIYSIYCILTNKSILNCILLVILCICYIALIYSSFGIIKENKVKLSKINSEININNIINFKKDE